MGVSANSYGTAAKVANLVPRVTSSGSFTASTNPATTAVETWIDEVSGTLNVALAGAGFAIPIIQATAVLALESVVCEAVADLCLYANSAGRFFTDKALERGVSPMKIIRTEMVQWVEDQAAGLAALGCTRTTPDAGQVAYRDTNEAGKESFPLFQRDGFSSNFKDWDPD